MKYNLFKPIIFALGLLLLTYKTKADVINEPPQTLPERTLFLVIVCGLLVFFGLWIIKRKRKRKQQKNDKINK
jgi:predicted transporter